MSKETVYKCSNCGSTNLYEGTYGYSCNDCDPSGNEFEEY